MESTRKIKGAARQVPDTFKNLEFADAISSKGEGNDTRDALSRVMAVIEKLKTGFKRDNEDALYGERAQLIFTNLSNHLNFYCNLPYLTW